jgi:hypothetical protein
VARIPTPVGPAPESRDQADRRRRLEALRDRLEGAIESASDRDLAPLAGRYQRVLADLAELGTDDAAEGDGFDDLSAARARRRSAAADS